MITAIRGINIKVRDQDAARQWWSQTVGLDVVGDVPMPDFPPRRWLETRGPQGGAVMVLHWPVFEEVEFFSGITFLCDDVRETCADLESRGVVLVTGPTEAGFGWWAAFRDPDGNVFVLRES